MDTDTLGRDKIQANVGISFWLMPLICFKGGGGEVFLEQVLRS